MGFNEEIDRQEKQLARLLDWISKADSKAQILIGAALAMIGAVLALAPEAAKKEWEPLVLVGIACIAPVVVLYFCFAAAMPFIKGPKDSLVFFGPIAARCKFETGKFTKNKINFEKGLEAYRSDLTLRTDESYLDDLNQQCLINATIADAKFRRVKRAWNILFVGAFVWLIVIFWLYRGFHDPEKKPEKITFEPMTINVKVENVAPKIIESKVTPKVVK